MINEKIKSKEKIIKKIYNLLLLEQKKSRVLKSELFNLKSKKNSFPQPESTNISEPMSFRMTENDYLLDLQNKIMLGNIREKDPNLYYLATKFQIAEDLNLKLKTELKQLENTKKQLTSGLIGISTNCDISLLLS